MSTIYWISLQREHVVAYLGTAWPPTPGDTVLRIPPDVAMIVSSGAVIVYDTPGMPGRTWWIVDQIIPPQDAGPVDESLAAQIPGSTLETVPAEPDPEPPVDPYPSAAAAAEQPE
jgi:hypothetical protein